jgi:hypothetical protein
MSFDWPSLSRFSSPESEYQKDFDLALERLTYNPNSFDINEYITQALSFKKTDDFGRYCTELLEQWRGKAPFNATVVKTALDYFGIDVDSPLYHCALVGGVLADVPHDNPYHNNHHFREVLFVLCLLMANHNNAATDKTKILTKDEITILIIAAAIHDFAHDGRGNMIKGTHIPSRTEKYSLKTAAPFLKNAGITNDVLKQLEIMLICTDVSRSEAGRSPSGMCRDIFLAHEYDNVSAVNVPEFYQPLIQNRKISFMATLLCEADIAVSTGLTYDYAQKMTRLVAEESEVLQPSANTLHGFMEVICHGGFLTQTSKTLMGDNFQSILLQAEDDKDNNILYT